MSEATNTIDENQQNECSIPVKKPKRVLHFSDGTMEEYSESEDETAPPTKTEDQVDTANMGWGPWLIHQALRSGGATIAACDYAGEALASFLGITTPKYQYELDEYRRMEKLQREDEFNARGWLHPPGAADGETQSPATEQPVTSVADGPTAV